MPDQAWTFITGATGYVGSEVAFDLLDRGHACLVLVRPSAEPRARELFGPYIRRDKVRLVRGDVAIEHCGLTDDQIRNAPTVRSVVHLAALARFSGFGYETMHRVNVGGTIQAFELARRLGAESFFHFSTAFVAGLTERVFAEDDLDVGQSFRNDYERTKFEGELALREHSRSSSVSITTVRPSIVVGDGRAGSGAGRGLFGILDILYWFKTQLESRGEDPAALRVHLPGRRDLEANLIALQAVSSLFARIFETPALWGGCYHLVNHEYTELGDVKRQLEKLLGIRGLRLEDEHSLCAEAETQSSLAKLFKRKLRPYFPYFETAPRWTRDKLDAAVPDWKKLSGAALGGTFLASDASAKIESHDSAWVDHFFERFLPSHVGDRTFREVRALDDVVGIVIEGARPPGRMVRFRYGKFEPFVKDPDSTPRCVIQLELPTFRQIVAGEIPPQRAFFEKKVRISGEIFFALKLGSLLEGFFRRNPYRAEELSPL